MSKELDVAKKAAKEAGKILLEYFQESNEVTLKEDKSFQTKIDKLAEEKIISIVKENFPDHSINAEESGLSDSRSSYLWLVDPIDGTTNYVTHLPFFSVSIALVENKNLKTAVIYDPNNAELFHAELGKGAWLNEDKLKISDKSKLNEFKLGYSRSGRAKTRFADTFAKVEKVTRTPKILGSTALQLGYVAAGRLDADISFSQEPWDIAAGVLLVQEAGGKVTDFEGKPWSLELENILASNGKIHAELLQQIKNR